MHLVFDVSKYKSRGDLIPQLKDYYKIDYFTGLYEPILYLSDFWVINRDLIAVDDESLDRIKRVRDGEVQTESAKMKEDEMTE